MICEVHRSVLQDIEAEKAAQVAAQATHGQQHAVPAKKRKDSQVEAQPRSKKQKMASVQALHTAHDTQARSSSVSQLSSVHTSGAHTDSAKSARESSASPESESSFDAASKPASSAADNARESLPRAAHQPDQKQKGNGLKQAAFDLEKGSSHVRKAAVKAAANRATASKQEDRNLTTVKEYLVKWKGQSHMHSTWVRHDDVVRMSQQSTGLKSRLRHFLQSNIAEQVGSAFAHLMRHCTASCVLVCSTSCSSLP